MLARIVGYDVQDITLAAQIRGIWVTTKGNCGSLVG